MFKPILYFIFQVVYAFGMNKLLKYTKEKNIQALEKCIKSGGYLKEDTDEVVEYLMDSPYDKNENKFKNTIDLLLPLIYDKCVWGKSSFVSWLVNESILHGDVDTLKKSLPLLSIEDKRPDGTFSYLENAVYAAINSSISEKTRKEMCLLLVEMFSDDECMALLRCVQSNLPSCFDVILPKSNISAENYFVYLWAMAYEREYFVEKLKPLISEFDALYGVSYNLPYPPEKEEKKKFNKAKLRIEKSLSNNLNNPVNKLWHLVCFSKNINEIESHVSENRIDNKVLIKMLEFAWDNDNKKAYRYILSKTLPGTLLISDMNKLMKRDLKIFEKHLPHTCQSMKNDLLYNAVFNENKKATFLLFESGVDWQETLEYLKQSKSKVYSLSIMEKHKKIQEKIHDNLIEYRTLFDKKSLEKQILNTDKKSPPKKI